MEHQKSAEAIVVAGCWRQRRAEPVMSGQSHALSERLEQTLRALETYVAFCATGSRAGARRCLLAARRRMNGTKLAGAVRPVDRNRRMRNRTYGGVGGRRG